MDATIAPRDLTRLRNNFNIDKRRRTGHHHQVQAHFHPFYELFYLTKGNCRFFLFNRNQVLKDGDVLIIPPGEYHYNVYGNGMHALRFILPTARSLRISGRSSSPSSIPSGTTPGCMWIRMPCPL